MSETDEPKSCQSSDDVSAETSTRELAYRYPGGRATNDRHRFTLTGGAALDGFHAGGGQHRDAPGLVRISPLATSFGREHRSDRCADTGTVVRGGPTGKIDYVRGEERIRIEHATDRLDLCPSDVAGRTQADHDAGHRSRADRNDHARTDGRPHAVGNGVGQQIEGWNRYGYESKQRLRASDFRIRK